MLECEASDGTSRKWHTSFQVRGIATDNGDPDTTSTVITPSSFHVPSTIGFDDVLLGLWAVCLHIFRLDQEMC